MGEPAMKEAHAEEPRVDVRAVQQAYENLSTHFTAIRSAFTQMQEAGITPVQVTYTDANVRQLLAALVQLDQRLRPSNGGQPVIPVSGSTDRDKFQSMNRWLGRDPNAALDAAGLQLLEQRVMAALGTPSADSSVGPILAQVTPTAAPQPAAPQPAAPQPAPVVAPQPTAREAVPVRTETAPQPVAAAAEQHVQLRDNLETIVTYGRNAGVRRSAQQALERINAEIERSGGPRDRQLARLVTAAERISTAELARAQTRAAEERMRGSEYASASTHPLAQRVTSIITDLQAIAADQSVSQERRDLANNLIGRLNDALLLGEDPASRMVTLIGEARDALRSGNEAVARTKSDEANTLFTTEQRFLRQRLEQFVVPIAQAGLTEIDGSHLPTRDEVSALASADGVSRGTYDHVAIRNTSGRIVRRVRTGREDIRAGMEARLTRARAMLQAAQAGEPLSHQAVTELYQSVLLEERTIGALIDLNEFARGHGEGQLSRAQRIGLRRAYTNAVVTLLDPDFNPYSQYSAETRRAMARAYLRIRGAAVTDAQVRRAERELLPALMRSSEFRYDEVIQKYYIEVSQLAPALSGSTATAVTRMADLRRLRPHMRAEYLPYVTGMRWEIVVVDGAASETTVSLAEAELQSQERLNMARGFLQEVIRSSGLPSTDAMVQAANRWVTASQGTVAAADIPQMADTLYHMARSLASIREAQLWRSTPNLGRTLSAAQQQHADALIQRAQTMYTWLYSSPQVDSGFHPNLPYNLSDRAIQLMAPVALQVTEGASTSAALEAYETPMSVGVTVADPANPTAAESASGARTAEERYLSFLASLRGDSNFGVPAYMSRDAASRRAFEVLEPMVGRNRTIETLLGHPILLNSEARGRTTVTPIDQHIPPSVSSHTATSPEQLAIGNQFLEDLRLSQYGQLYQEVRRLAIMRVSSETPEMLRTIDAAPLRSRMWQLSRSYATATATEQLAAGNEAIISILDTRLTELRQRLDGEIALVSGNRFRRRDLARSTDPRVMYVTRAVEAERMLTTLRGQLHSARAGDLYTGRMDPRQAIATAEMAIASLDDDTLRQFPDPAPVGLSEDLANYSFYVPRTSIRQDAYSRGSSARIRFTAEQVMVREGDGEAMSLADFQRRYRSQSQATVNLTYYWFVYQNRGRRGPDGHITQYLRNPQYDPDSTIEARRQSHIGQVMTNVTLTDGTVIPRAVVRVRPSGLTSTEGPEFLPIMDGRQRVRPSDVLFLLEADGFSPVRDERLQRTLTTVCTPTDANQYWTYRVGESTPVVFVSPRSTTPVARSR